MKKPFKAGQWTLDDEAGDGVWMLAEHRSPEFRQQRQLIASDADLRHIARLCAKALKYRRQGKRGAK